MFRFDQFLSGRSDVFHSRFVSVQLLFEVLVFLNFSTQICRIQVTFVGGEFQFFVNPPFRLVTISFELLQSVGILEDFSAKAGLLFQCFTSFQKLQKNIFRRNKAARTVVDCGIERVERDDGRRVDIENKADYKKLTIALLCATSSAA